MHLRLKEDAAAREALLIAGKQENEVTKRTLTEALDQIEELVKEVECTNYRVQQLQDCIQRSVHGNIAVIWSLIACLDFFLLFYVHERRFEQSAAAREATLLTERQEKEATSKALAESQGTIEGLVKDRHSADRKIDQLQKTVERFVMFITRNQLHRFLKDITLLIFLFM